MPRKEWVPKNKYRKRSRLVEHDFIVLVNCYCTEALLNYSRKECYSYYIDMLPEDDIAERDKQLTPASFNDVFNEISQYIWDNLVLELSSGFEREDIFDDLLRLIYGKIDSISHHRAFYDLLDKFPLYVNADNINNSLMFYLLSKRSKRLRGFKSDKFYLEFSRVFFICAVIGFKEMKLSSIYSIKDIDIMMKINEHAFFILMQYFRKKPL